MKNRIWKQMKKVGIVTVLTGVMLGGTIEPKLILGADFLPGQAPFIDQSVFWKDRESGQAELGIRIRGLNEWLSGRRFSEDKEKNEKWDDELQETEDPSVEQEEETEQKLPEDDWQQEEKTKQELPVNKVVEGIGIEMEEGYEHVEQLASGETVCKENEAPEEESESTQERTETGGENVESAALPLEGVEEEDMDMEEDMSEDTEDAEEPEEMPEEEPEEISPSADADTEQADMTLSLTSETEEMKAGKTIRYRVDLANTGDVDLIDIQMTSSFSCPKITQQWEEAEGLDGEGADAEVAELKAGEKRSFYILAPLLNEQEKDLEHKVEAGAKVKGRPEEMIFRKAQMVSPLQPLKADFSVKKTADRETAMLGETVTYQICIINTGEKTLHSVVGTERFQAEGIEARFVEQEGITLNSTKTKALIEKIAPGEAVSLQAEVKIPEKTVNQKLFNKVTVTSQETGEKQMEASDEITVEGNETPTPEESPEEKTGGDPSSGQEEMARAASSHPQTGDNTEPSLFVLLAVSAGVTGMGVLWLRRKYARIYGGK